jgi:riboflavin kinase/FMN adenylyltransferase
VVAPVTVGGVEARSTTIRRLLTAGDVAAAARLLGRPYQLWGEVVRGKQLGRTLGFPTANVAAAPGVLVPGAGVYAARVTLQSTGESLRAAVSVGTNPTVTPGGAEVSVEAFVLDGFARDLYGQRIGVDFLHYLRGMERFDGLDALIAQMHRDVAAAERLIPLASEHAAALLVAT